MVGSRFGFWKGFVAAFLTIAVVGSGVAYATADFDDVPDTAFYADATTWAKANGITTGSPAGSRTFKPNDPVTRGESVTFLKRYDENVVQPGLAAVTASLNSLPDTYTKAEVDAAVATAIEALPTVYWARVSSAGAVQAGSAGVSVASPGTGQYDVTFPENVGGCAIHTTMSARADTIGLVFIGLAFASEAYVVVTDNTSTDDATVRVATFIHDTAAPGGLATATNLPFSVMATCP